MKTYLKTLQLSANIKNIVFPPGLIKKDVKLPISIWNKPSLVSKDRKNKSTDSWDDTSEGNLWTCLFREENNGELGYDDNCVHFQLYYIISSMTYYYEATLEEQISRKHLLIRDTLNNMFLSAETKTKLREIFVKAQRTYMAFLRFANLVRHKIGKEKINFDLRMEPIDIRSKYSICLIQDKAKYFFALTDLVNIIQTAITNSDNMFDNPLFPKNPYTNVRFTKTHLYNIYYKIKHAFLNVPEWIELFYKSGFDLDLFKLENEQKLREKYAKNYIKNGAINVLYEEVMSMLYSYKRIFRRIDIHDDFPKKDLVDIFRPYLFLYVMSVDGIDGIEKKRLSNIILRRKLEEFVTYNRSFGRKTVTTNYVLVSRFAETEDSNPNLVRHTAEIEGRNRIVDNCSQDLSSNTFSFTGSTVQRRQVVNVTFNMKHPKFTLKDACECFDKKLLFKPPAVVSTHNSVDRGMSSESSEEDEVVNNFVQIPITTSVVQITSNMAFNNNIDIINDIYNELNHLGDLTLDEETNDTDSIS